MIKSNEIYNQINRITQELIGNGLCVEFNFPSQSKKNSITEISISKYVTGLTQKNMSYSDMFYELNRYKSFNIKMLDGALITMLYKFSNKKIESHILSFFPSPDLENFQNEPEIYLEDEIYADVIDKRIVTVPLRFDYDDREKVYEKIRHPKSHLTIGQYKNCRIPVYSALTPNQFIMFIMRNFYHSANKIFEVKFDEHNLKFEKSIFHEEEKIAHFKI